MKINIIASSNVSFMKGETIDVNSIEEAIKRLQTDKNLVKSVINIDYTFLTNYIPDEFILKTSPSKKDCDYEIEIYDYYRE